MMAIKSDTHIYLEVEISVFGSDSQYYRPLLRESQFLDAGKLSQMQRSLDSRLVPVCAPGMLNGSDSAYNPLKVISSVQRVRCHDSV